MTSKTLCVLGALAFLAGCDYCPRPGVLEFTPQFYYPRTPKYPVPNSTPCGVVPGPGQLGMPASIPVAPPVGGGARDPLLPPGQVVTPQ